MTNQTIKCHTAQWNQAPSYYECGICGHYHPLEWNGDCRDDSNRFTQDELTEKHGMDWTEVPMPGTEGMNMTNETKHTPEPWKVDLESEATFAHDGRTEEIIELTNADHSETGGYAATEANARRIVACVNACAGIETSILQAVDKGELLRTARIRLAETIRQRDELAALMRKARDAMSDLNQSEEDDGTLLAEIDAALAKLPS